MKKIFLGLVLIIVLGSLAFAQGQQGTHEAGAGVESSEADDGAGLGMQENTETAMQNMGEESQIKAKVQTMAEEGTFTTHGGMEVQIQEQANNRMQLKAGGVSAETSMKMEREKTGEGEKLRVKLSNGKDAEIKVMPSTASEKALERLRLKVCSEENNCQIELKEVGSGEQIRVAYEVQAEKQARVLGLFKTRMQVQAQVDAENGEVIQSKKPWWAFLASEPEE